MRDANGSSMCELLGLGVEMAGREAEERIAEDSREDTIRDGNEGEEK